ncbi:MAG: hypothetical protein COS76_01440 [Candidatus Portnoybacteria bacterium CG06_land_8_20_14_3_00_39_12]|uniref:Uncharacterized protein n=1 Tax=Candidatus Portnoybacteria bacterium CG06_land_8_20_14_3_00_39_12 TaxID=1974809 RepID=A0A2M7AXE5_9BACT|nr:MAG: hypothetical protein COS76_01440 [Candidatus Portnoybacteria bacterium CG06_land_8_20_14_3_00_39_12]
MNYHGQARWRPQATFRLVLSFFIYGQSPWYSRNGNKIYLLEKNCICKKVKVEVEVGFEEVIKESIIIILERHFRKIL